MKRYWILLLVLMLSVSAFAQRKALVIGNSGYAGNVLNTPLNDAQLVKDAFEAMDYEVIKYTDLDYTGMLKAINDFKKTLQSDETAIFYYSGYTKQQDGRNYLIPYSKTKIKDLDKNLISADVVMEAMSRANYSFMFLESRQLSSGFFKGLCGKDKGLAAQNYIGENQGFAMAHAADKALESQGAKYGLFTHSLLKFMGSDMHDFSVLMEMVSGDVYVESGGVQTPYWRCNLKAPFTFWEPLQKQKFRFHMPLYKNLDGGGSYNF